LNLLIFHYHHLSFLFCAKIFCCLPVHLFQLCKVVAIAQTFPVLFGFDTKRVESKSPATFVFCTIVTPPVKISIASDALSGCSFCISSPWFECGLLSFLFYLPDFRPIFFNLFSIQPKPVFIWLICEFLKCCCYLCLNLLIFHYHHLSFLFCAKIFCCLPVHLFQLCKVVAIAQTFPVLFGLDTKRVESKSPTTFVFCTIVTPPVKISIAPDAISGCGFCISSPWFECGLLCFFFYLPDFCPIFFSLFSIQPKPVFIWLICELLKCCCYLRLNFLILHYHHLCFLFCAIIFCCLPIHLFHLSKVAAIAQTFPVWVTILSSRLSRILSMNMVEQRQTYQKDY